ncbi:MAG: T9SS type A sorting domain-containing protein [Luteibaculaceae bacterium]
MQAFYIIFVLLFSPAVLFAQEIYTLWRVGSSQDAVVTGYQSGILLAGGGIDQDGAMTWFLNRAGGGDVVVLRASGGDLYNDYLYSDLGVTVNSVTTIRFNSAEASTNTIVLNTLANAEAVFIAGGNQFDYYNYWQGTPVMDTLNYLINVKQIVIGGTSAGMAILGEGYYAALPGSTPGVTSAQALANPFNAQMQNLNHGNFLKIPFLENTITDTHYEDRNRPGRHSVFIGRLAQQTDSLYFGIACNDHCAVTVDENGLARAWGEFPAFQADRVFFIQSNCQDLWLPEIMQTGLPVTWNRNQRALKVYRLPATLQGTNTFSLADWETGTGGIWQRWWINNGLITQASSSIAGCEPDVVSINTLEPVAAKELKIYPNPSQDDFWIEVPQQLLQAELSILSLDGRLVWSKRITLLEHVPFKVNAGTLSIGNYIVRLVSNDGLFYQKVVIN